MLEAKKGDYEKALERARLRAIWDKGKKEKDSAPPVEPNPFRSPPLIVPRRRVVPDSGPKEWLDFLVFMALAGIKVEANYT
jgi:hypothetical protein